MYCDLKEHLSKNGKSTASRLVCVGIVLTMLAAVGCGPKVEERWLDGYFSTVPTDGRITVGVNKFYFDEDGTGREEVWDCDQLFRESEFTWEMRGDDEALLTPQEPSQDIWTNIIVRRTGHCNATTKIEVFETETLYNNKESDGVPGGLSKSNPCMETTPAPPCPEGTECDGRGCEVFWCDEPPASCE